MVGEIGHVFWEMWLRSNSWWRTVSTICWQKREGRSLVQILIRSERKAWRERRASWIKEGRNDRHESKKKGLTQEYILFTPLEELYSNGLSEDGTGKIHHLKARTQSNAMQAERDCHMVWNTLSNYVAPWSPTAKGYTLATRSKPNWHVRVPTFTPSSRDKWN